MDDFSLKKKVNNVTVPLMLVFETNVPSGFVLVGIRDDPGQGMLTRVQNIYNPSRNISHFLKIRDILDCQGHKLVIDSFLYLFNIPPLIFTMIIINIKYNSQPGNQRN